MQVPVILAHGALGWADELIFLGVIVVFLGMMFISWFRSRNMDFDENDLMPQDDQQAKHDTGEERFQLD